MNIYIMLMVSFFKIGALTFGGGLAMLPWIYQEINKFYEMDQHKFAELVALSQMTPGAIGVNAATFVGYDVLGVVGGIISTVAVVLPAFIFMNIILRVGDKIFQNEMVKKGMIGVKAAVVGMIYSAALIMMKSALILENKGFCPVKIAHSMTTFNFSSIFHQLSTSINLLGLGAFALSLILVQKIKMPAIKVLTFIFIVSFIISFVLREFS